jgi:hypothetical protein
MRDPNEEVVRLYLELEGFFVRSNVKYFRSKKRTGKGSGGWGDLDLLAWHPNGRRYLIEVKGWRNEAFVPSYFIRGDPYIDRIEKEEAARVFGTKRFKTVLVVPRVSYKLHKEVERLARREGIDEVWQFDAIMDKIREHVKEQQNHGSEILHTIRLSKIYSRTEQQSDQ